MILCLLSNVYRLKCSQVRNYDPVTYSLTRVKSRDASASKNVSVSTATITSPRKPGQKRLVLDFNVLAEQGPTALAVAEVQVATIVLEHERTSQERHNIV